MAPEDRYAKLTGHCAVCGERMQKNTGKWRHAQTMPDGSPHDHNAVELPKRTRKKVMTINTDDWPTTQSTFQVLFSDLETRQPPRGLTGHNFVTSEWLGYVRTPAGEPVEITTGWFLDHRVFGVTFSRLPNGLPDPRDQMCNTLEEALELVRPSS